MNSDHEAFLDAIRGVNSEHGAFLDAICREPADDTARLVYADYLEEHGEPERAEFVRRQCRGEAATVPPVDDWEEA